ncbi:MAG: hypothetical protein ABFD89_26150 [Bryobacteraceae bacterium]
MSTALRQVFALLESASSPKSKIPPTLLYNEGWLLRLVLSVAEKGVPCLPFQFLEGATWFSEALLCSAFLPRYRGDQLAESWTHADGIVGHFRFSPDSKAGMTLDANGSQLVVLEAKIFSGLSRGTKRAPDFDQAARNVACIADALRRSGRSVDQWTSLAFCLLAPRAQIQSGIFAQQLSKESMAERIASRVGAYEADSRVRLDEWHAAWVIPLLKTIQIHCIDWESVIQKICEHDEYLGQGIQRFYDLTLKFNGRPGADSANLVSMTSSGSHQPPC